MKRSRDYTEENEEILNYMNHVKTIFGAENSDRYNEFLHLVVRLKNQQSELQKNKRRLKELLHGYTDLIMGFNAIMQERYRISIDEEPRTKGGSYRDQVVGFLNDLKVMSNNNGGNPTLYMGFLCVMRDHHKKGLPIEEVNVRVRVLLQNHTDLLHKFISFQSESEKEITVPVPDRKMGFLDRLLSAGDNPSYVRNHKQPPASNNSELVGEINKSWIISKKVGKGSGEKADDLRTKEDDFCKLDTSVRVVQSTMMRVQNLVKKIEENPSLEVGIKDLKVADLRCIRGMYGDREAAFMDFLRDKTTAAKALPIILIHLQQKYNESGKLRSDFTGKTWDSSKVDYSDYLMYDKLKDKDVVVM